MTSFRNPARIQRSRIGGKPGKVMLYATDIEEAATDIKVIAVQ
ncbi:hypothetical protein [Thiolapillus sp.]|nr:hypothetical protein [Thiolapillus sp.]